MFSCFKASILAANTAAFLAPGLPIATVATGIPGGIWAIESSESKPDKAAGKGTPITGRFE